jgi:hypothetical protein
VRSGGELRRNTGLNAMSAKRRAQLAAQGVTNPGSTLNRTPTGGKPNRARYTGPTRAVCRLVDARSGGRCEWPDCPAAQAHRHHRLNRKMGGRHGEAQKRLNSAAWVVAACGPHHDHVTSASGDALDSVRDCGWVLTEQQDATLVGVHTCHDPGPVWLDNNGGWSPYPPPPPEEFDTMPHSLTCRHCQKALLIVANRGGWVPVRHGGLLDRAQEETLFAHVYLEKVSRKGEQIYQLTLQGIAAAAALAAKL